MITIRSMDLTPFSLRSFFSSSLSRANCTSLSYFICSRRFAQFFLQSLMNPMNKDYNLGIFIKVDVYASSRTHLTRNKKDFFCFIFELY
jgi:hypothetical protein